MSKYRRDLLALLGYLLLTLVLTYPLILNFTTHVAGDGGDDPALAWNLWWVRYALLDLNTTPIYTDYMFFPIGLNLGFYTLTYLNAFLSIPIQFAFGLIPAANLNLILSFTLSGLGTYLLVQYLLRQMSLRGATAFDATKQSTPDNSALLTKNTSESTILFLSAFLAGVLYAFSANKFLYAALGQFNIASSQWIPFYVLILIKLFDSPRPPLKLGFLLGFFLLAQALSEFIFASFLILFSIVYVIYWLIKIRFKILNYQLSIINLLLAVLVFTIPMLPILSAMFSDLATEGDFIQQGLGFSNIFSADVLGFFIPSHLHPLFGALESQLRFPYFNFMFLGFAALILGILALWKVKPARIWGLWFILFALISLGPTLRLNGAEFDLPLPFDALLEIPLVRGNRYPSRWSVMLTLCLAVLVGYGIAWLATKITARASHSNSNRLRPVLYGAFTLIGILFVFEHLSTPLPLSDFRVPSPYQQIAQDRGNFSVMEIPLAWRNGFRVTGSYRQDSQTLPDAIFMFAQWYQTAQQHPILNGNTSRNPELKFQYFAETPVLNSLVAIQTGHSIDAETQARDRELAPRLLQFFGTRYLVWHTPIQPENRAVADRTRAYLESTFPITKQSESYENGRGTALYRVHDAPTSDTITIRPDDPLARLYFGEGWGALGYDTVRAERQDTRIFFPLAEPRALTLTLDNLIPYPSSGQGLTVSINGNRIGDFDPIPITDGSFSIPIPASALQSGINTLELHFDETMPVTNIPDLPVSILVRSAGEEQGAFGHIYVNGVDESPNQRGYNVVVIEPRTGKIQARETFDTHLTARESTRLVGFLQEIPEGDLVAIAASDEASLHLTTQAVEALRTIGADEDLRGKFRWSHAIIGVKGALPGSASESASETNVSQVYLNFPLTSSNLAVTLGEIRLQAAP